MDATQTLGFVYCGVSVLCAVILFLNAKAITEITSRYTISRYVFYSYLFAGFAALFDCAFALREINGIVFPPFVSYILTLAYVICSNLTGMFWIYYAEYKQKSWISQTKKRMIVFTVPLVILLLLTLSTPFTHVYFYFEENTYQRGSLFLPVSSLLFIYVVQNGIKSLIYALKKENYVERHELRRLFVYAFSYLLIQALQLALPDIFPYRSVGLMLVFAIFQIQNMKEMIGLDGLTRINNRYAVDRYLGTVMAQNHDFEIVLLDIDKFKGLNDKHGHIEGDKALKLVAEALNEVSPKNSFYARWGGDEFIVINPDRSHSISDIEEKLNQSLAALTARQNCGYDIIVSAGYLVKDGSFHSIPDLLKSADEKLYTRKASKQR